MNPTSIQEQEEYDYEMGSAGELENALRKSRMGTPLTDAKITEALSEGKFVVAGWSNVYCKSTDAFMGQANRFVSAHATRQEAEAECKRLAQTDDPESGFRVFPS